MVADRLIEEVLSLTRVVAPEMLIPAVRSHSLLHCRLLLMMALALDIVEVNLLGVVSDLDLLIIASLDQLHTAQLRVNALVRFDRGALPHRRAGFSLARVHIWCFCKRSIQSWR
jgi:hypothetical protein